MDQRRFERDDDVDAQRLHVEALGEPGQRRFRLMAVVGGETHVIWLEKQQLQALGVALEQVLRQLPEHGPDLESTSPPIDFDLSTRRQFRAGRLELGYDERRDRLVVIAHDISSEQDEADIDVQPPFLCRLTRSQARSISNEAITVVAAGRPRCPMCGQPMGPGPHVCPQQNGHLPHVIDLADLADDDDDEEEL